MEGKEDEIGQEERHSQVVRKLLSAVNSSTSLFENCFDVKTDRAMEKSDSNSKNGKQPNVYLTKVATQLVYSSAGKILLALYPKQKDRGLEGMVRRWGVATGKELPGWSIEIAADDSLVWSLDGSMLAIVRSTSRG